MKISKMEKTDNILLMRYEVASELVKSLNGMDKDWTYSMTPHQVEFYWLWSVDIFDAEGNYISTFKKPNENNEDA